MEVAETRHMEFLRGLEEIRDKVTDPVIVPAPAVTVEAAEAPIVNIDPVVIPAPLVTVSPVVQLGDNPPFPPHPEPVRWRWTVERDTDGKITGGQIFPEGTSG